MNELKGRRFRPSRLLVADGALALCLVALALFTVSQFSADDTSIYRRALLLPIALSAYVLMQAMSTSCIQIGLPQPEHAPKQADDPGGHTQPASRSSSRGSTLIEMAILTPALILMLGLVAAGGRMAGAHGMVADAANSGARAASLTQTSGAARHVADDTVSVALAQTGSDCVTHSTAVDPSNFHAGGSVTVTVTCDISLSGLSLIPLGTTQVTETATSPIDTYRSGR